MTFLLPRHIQCLRAWVGFSLNRNVHWGWLPMPNPNPYLNPNPNAQWGCLPDAYANQTSHYTTCAGLEQGGGLWLRLWLHLKVWPHSKAGPDCRVAAGPGQGH